MKGNSNILVISYEGGVLYPTPVTDGNYFKQLLDAQVSLKAMVDQKHQVDKEAERFKMRIAQQQLEDERFDDRRREQARAMAELHRFRTQAQMYPGDRCDEEKRKLQDDMLLGFENMNPILQPTDRVKSRSRLSLSTLTDIKEKPVPPLFIKAPSSAHRGRKPFKA